eukprot:1157772-Pelagomonas_calceolata.AAC.3
MESYHDKPSEMDATAQRHASTHARKHATRLCGKACKGTQALTQMNTQRGSVMRHARGHTGTHCDEGVFLPAVPPKPQGCSDRG